MSEELINEAAETANDALEAKNTAESEQIESSESQKSEESSEVNYDLAASKNSSEDVDDDLPEGIKARIGRANKRISSLEQELQKKEALLKQYAPQDEQYYNQYGQNDTYYGQSQQQYNQDGLVYDPLSGQYVDPNTTQGSMALYLNQVQQHSQQREQEAQKQNELQRKAQELEKVNQEFASSVYEAKNHYEDYEDVVTSVNFTDAIVDASKLAPNAGDLLYLLGKNPREVARISQLSPLQQAREVLKHSLELQSRKKVSSAPPPSEPLGETANSSGPADASNYAQWKEFNRAKQRKR